MINQKTLIKLGVVTVVAVAAAFVIDHSRQPVNEFSAQAGSFVTGLSDHVNDVSRISLTTANKQNVVTLVNDEGSWKVAQKGGYPADIGKLREYLLKLANANLIEQKTAKKDRYVDLGVEDIGDPLAKGVEVTLDGLSMPVGFIAGNFSTQAGGTYVRRSDEAQSWLATGNLIPDKKAADWLKKEVVSITADRIAAVTITHADGKVVHVSRKSIDDANFTIADVPKGREPISEFAASGLATVLAELNLDDVAPAKDVAVPADATKVRYATFDGVVIDAVQWQSGETHYVTFAASLDAQVADRRIAEDQAKADKPAVEKPDGSMTEPGSLDAAKKVESTDEKAVSDPVKDRLQRLATLKDEVDKLNAAFNGWSFVLPSHKISNINKSMEDLLKPLASKAGEMPKMKDASDN